MSNSYEPPKSGKGDKAHIATKIALSVIPVPAVTEIFEAIIQPPLDKRREKWMESIADGLQ